MVGAERFSRIANARAKTAARAEEWKRRGGSPVLAGVGLVSKDPGDVE
jgi:hypothetical protein